jgi:hypothetical protein
MSAFYDLASVVLVPSGYKSGKIYAQKPLTTDGQLTFTRASTATRVNASGLIETVASGVPRLDYLGSTCPKLLLEPQRTNLAQQSQSFDNGYWEKGSVATITANSVVSPDGTQNADTLTANGTGSLFARVNCYLGTAQTCSNSLFVKKANHRYVGLRNSGTTSQHDVFDFDTKTWTNNSGATLSYEEHANGWFRLKSTNTDTVSLNYYWSVIPAKNTSGEETQTVSNLSVYIWGAQAEQNAAYCTSYIPTTSAAVTRVEDAAYKTGISSLIGQTEGTIFFEVDKTTRLDNDYRVQISDGTTNNWLFVSVEVGNSIRLYCNVGGVNQFSVYGSVVTSGRHKVAMAYKANDFKVYVDGVAWITQTSGNVPACSKLNLGSPAPTVDAANTDSKTAQALLFKTRLTNAQLAELTTL